MAYGFPDRHAEVANQIRGQLATSVLGDFPPSEIIENRLTEQHIVSALQGEYGVGEEFTKFVDNGQDSVEKISKDVYVKILQSYNEMSTYETSLTDVLEYVGLPINPQRVKNHLMSNVPDLELFTKLAAGVGYNKLNKLPSGARIELSDNISLDKDANGVSFPTGYLTPDQYFNDVAYPGVGSTAENLPNTLVTSLIEGYKGYPTLQPLDDLLRPGLAALVSNSDISGLKNPAQAIAGISTIDTVRDISGLGSIGINDQIMYNIDLTKIVIGLNGYTVYDPAKDSNGDFIDRSLIPDFDSENADQGSGLPYFSRPRTSAFES